MPAEWTGSESPRPTTPGEGFCLPGAVRAIKQPAMDASAQASGAAANADQKALARQGATVRARLARDPSVQRLAGDAGDKAELFGVAGFLGLDECARLCAMVDAVARPSHTFDYGEASPYRTSFSGDVDRTDPFVRMIERRIDDLLGLDPALGETVQGQRYTQGQQFNAHFDWFATSAAYWPEQRARGGQRSWTAMVYLNTVAAGGATEFPELCLAIPPQEGTLLAWNNATREGLPNRAMLHAAAPVVQGRKYVITKWYRTRAWG